MKKDLEIANQTHVHYEKENAPLKNSANKLELLQFNSLRGQNTLLTIQNNDKDTKIKDFQEEINRLECPDW